MTTNCGEAFVRTELHTLCPNKAKQFILAKYAGGIQKQLVTTTTTLMMFLFFMQDLFLVQQVQK